MVDFDGRSRVQPWYKLASELVKGRAMVQIPFWDCTGFMVYGAKGPGPGAYLIHSHHDCRLLSNPWKEFLEVLELLEFI